MDSHIIFIGGAKGVGKTSTMNEANKHLQLPVLHTGSIYLDSLKKGIDGNQVIYEEMLSFNGIVDSHYAGKSDGKFVRGLPQNYVVDIALQRPEITFMLVDSNIDDLLKRIERDNISGTKRREMNPEKIEEELNLSRKFFFDYVQETGRKGIIIDNRTGNFEQTVRKIYETIVQATYKGD